MPAMPQRGVADGYGVLVGYDYEAGRSRPTDGSGPGFGERCGGRSIGSGAGWLSATTAS